jgi:DNA-binding beta-propeller fold protein YncE
MELVHIARGQGIARAGRALTAALSIALAAVACKQGGPPDAYRPGLDPDRPASGCRDAPGQLLQCLLSIDLPVHPWTDRRLAREERRGGPKSVWLDPGGTEVWVALLQGPPALRVYEVATGEELATLDLGGGGAVEFEATRDGETLWVSQLETDRIYEIDRAQRSVRRTFPAGGQWPKVLELGFGGKRLFVSNWTSSTIGVIDLDRGELIQQWPTTEVPRGLYATADGWTLYVAGFGSGNLEDIGQGEGGWTTVYESDGALRHLVADEERRLLYVSDMRRGLVLRAAMPVFEVEEWVSTAAKPNTIQLSPDGRLLFVSCRGENNPESFLDPGPEWGSLMVFDTSDGRLLDAVVAGNQPTGLHLSADGSLLAQSDFIDNRVTLYRVPSYEALAAGGGGRSGVFHHELGKPDWTLWRPASP